MKELLIKKEALKEGLLFYNIEINDYIEKCYQCLENINNNIELKNKINYVLNLLYTNTDNIIEKLWKERDLEEYLGKNYNKFIHSIIIISGYKIHEENMNKYKFDKYQISTHKKRVRECLTNDIYKKNLKAIRLSQLLWGLYFINIRLIEVGRLQYEYCNKDNKKCIKIHIPPGSKLLLNEVINSLEKSKFEIKRYFYLENIEYYCESWLLSKEIKSLLNSNSNIYNFQKLFDIKDGENAIKDILNFVYGLQEVNNFEELKEDTKLQKKIKKLLLNKTEIHKGIGKLKSI